VEPKRRPSIARFFRLALIFIGVSARSDAQDALSREQLRHACASACGLDHESAAGESTTLGQLVPYLPSTYRALAPITCPIDEYLGGASRLQLQIETSPPDIAADLFRSLETAVTGAEPHTIQRPVAAGAFARKLLEHASRG
jgi:hypothetical protein